MQQENRTYKPVIFANHELNVPEMNWRVSISVDYFNFNDTTPYKVFWQLEPEEVSHVEEKLIKNHQFYDLILTFNNNVLSVCPNAVLFPVTGLWAKEADASQKKFAVSFLTSEKKSTLGHIFRVNQFIKLKSVLPHSELTHITVPVDMHMSPPYLPDKRSMLVPYQYAVAIQNSQQHNYFSEILLDCFATKTIPIFWGCANIADFFNPDGIIQFSDASCDDTTGVRLQEVLAGVSLTPERYNLPHVQAAIEENYQKALLYEDRIGRLLKAITDAWIPRIGTVHSGKPNTEVKI